MKTPITQHTMFDFMSAILALVGLWLMLEGQTLPLQAGGLGLLIAVGIVEALWHSSGGSRRQGKRRSGYLRHIPQTPFAPWRFMALLALAVVTVAGNGAYDVAHAAPDVAEPFTDYYNAHQGMRVLGYPLTGLVEAGSYPAQYFEKGRIEDHRADVHDPAWAFMYGRLTVELMSSNPQGSVSTTNLTYSHLQQANNPTDRVPAPSGFSGGTLTLQHGQGTFVPYDPQLRPAPGYMVIPEFWQYINRPELFPGGWLHDIGLPVAGAESALVAKQGETRTITMQAFERTVLTFDPKNPEGWQVERANIGADALGVAPAPSPTGEATVWSPEEGARVMLPVHLFARLGNPGAQVTASLTWQDGTKLTNSFTLLPGSDGKGLIVGNFDWVNMLQPPEPATQAATLQIRDSSGKVLAQRNLTVVGPNDPNTTQIKLFWTVSGAPDIVQPQMRRVIKTERMATTALEELLWGPPTISQIGFGTAIPTPQDVLRYPGRQADWGPRVALRSLTIENGVATADFSREMQAYGGGSLRVKLIGDQITQTLKQFPGVREVRIAIEGQTEGVLQP